MSSRQAFLSHPYLKWVCAMPLTHFKLNSEDYRRSVNGVVSAARRNSKRRQGRSSGAGRALRGDQNF